MSRSATSARSKAGWEHFPPPSGIRLIITEIVARDAVGRLGRELGMRRAASRTLVVVCLHAGPIRRLPVDV
jgi:hypothetical protein